MGINIQFLPMGCVGWPGMVENLKSASIFGLLSSGNGSEKWCFTMEES